MYGVNLNVLAERRASLVSSSAPVLGNGKEVLGNALALSLEHVL